MKQIQITPSVNSYTRNLNLNFDSITKGYRFKSSLVGTIINTIENLKDSLADSLKRDDPRPFLYSSEAANEMLRILNDAGLIGTVLKLRAHFKGDFILDDFSLRRNTARLNAIVTMLIEALNGQGMAA